MSDFYLRHMNEWLNITYCCICIICMHQSQTIRAVHYMREKHLNDQRIDQLDRPTNQPTLVLFPIHKQIGYSIARVVRFTPQLLYYYYYCCYF